MPYQYQNYQSSYPQYQQNYPQNYQYQNNGNQQGQQVAQVQPQIQPQSQLQSQQPQIVQPQIQNGGLVYVRSLQEAFNYPVAPGTSVTFKDENSPYMYTKTKGFSQLEQPVFDVYRLVKEDTNAQNAPVGSSDAENENKNISVEYVSIEDFNAATSEIERLSDIIKDLQNKVETISKKPASRTKKEEKGDES